MKKLIGICSIALLLVNCGGKQEVEVGMRTTLKVKPIFNAGNVAKGEVIKATFTVENTGDNPLVLANVVGSCSCTIADWTKEPIQPGETGTIKAQVKTESFEPGQPINKNVRVIANTTPAETSLQIQANIIK